MSGLKVNSISEPARKQHQQYSSNCPEGERRPGTSLLSGAAGYVIGTKTGGHGMLGAVDGEIFGTFLRR